MACFTNTSQLIKCFGFSWSPHNCFAFHCCTQNLFPPSFIESRVAVYSTGCLTLDSNNTTCNVVNLSNWKWCGYRNIHLKPRLRNTLCLQGEDYVIDQTSASVESLREKKSKLVASRKATGSIVGWDVPASSLKFSAVLGKGRFGDIFIGQMDGQEVLVKVLQPDCGTEGKFAFDRELDILR